MQIANTAELEDVLGALLAHHLAVNPTHRLSLVLSPMAVGQLAPTLPPRQV
jgi:hypothetical protein